LNAKLAEDFKNSMILREDADYGRGFSKKGAASTIKCAEAFYKATKKNIAEIINAKILCPVSCNQKLAPWCKKCKTAYNNCPKNNREKPR